MVDTYIDKVHNALPAQIAEFTAPFFNFCKTYTTLVGVLGLLTLFLGVILIVIIALSVKVNKTKKALRKAQTLAAVNATSSTPVEETQEENADAEAEEKAEAEAEAKAKAEAEEKAKAEAEAKAKAEAEEKAKAEAESKAKAEAEKKAKAEAEKKAKAEAEAEKKAKAEAEKKAKAEMAVSAEKSAKEEKAPRYRGKWIITKLVTEGEDAEETYFFELRASNGEKLLESEEYTSLNGAKKGIATHVANIKAGNFKVGLSKKGDYIFKLMSGKNMLLCTGENYASRARCESAIESTKRFAETAIIEETVETITVKVPVEEDNATMPLPDGYNGKWIIVKAKTADDEDTYYFELYANNGEKLLSSEEYSSHVGAVNGLETHKKNIEKGNFRIALTKRGDYIYKLLNGNGQLLCLGEHYKTKRLCQRAVESVKRFAMNSPMLVDSEHTK